MPKKRPPKDDSSTLVSVPAPQPDPILPGVNPAAEEHAVPATSLPYPIVAVGASAGGLEAFTELLQALPADTGMAFVMIQHLSPTHGSILAEILGRATPMPVSTVRNNMRVEPNHVYVIPPGTTMVLSDGHLQLSPRTESRGLARPIDHFMRSLAEEHGHKGIGVVLSGTGNDGTLGIEEIKAAGGITFVQDNTAEHTSMPRSAMAAGAVDFVLAPADIAAELTRIARHPYVGPAIDQGLLPLNEEDMQQILDIMREHSGVDFSRYKRNTLYRRILRRLLLHRLESAREYLKLLERTPQEVEALYQDVLINVTSFFRNPDAYEALKTLVFPKLNENRSRNDQVRVWALGCSTGEEAYSIAIAYSEYLEESGQRVPMQVFATDLNGAGIERARTGVYGKGIVQDVSPERLRRYFTEVDGSYRIAKPIRDMCVFARQNVLADPPFSRLDMVACRNMLIYLEPVLQQKLIPLLHYSLQREGFLWLGSSETIGSYRDLFELLDPKNKVYAKKHAGRVDVAVPIPTGRWNPRVAGTPVMQAREISGPDPQKEADRILLSRYSPPGVMLNPDLEIVQFRGDTSPFLSPAPGKASLNLLKMLRDGLMVAVRGAIARARRDQLPAREEGLRVKSNGGWRSVDVVVLPLKSDAPGGSLLVLFEEPAHSLEARVRQMDAESKAVLDKGPGEGGGESELARLKQELGATRDYLQSVIEQQEAANEELQSANEEVQSANEELQSINEELETSKEEIQSSNEELATVNEELQNRNLEITQSNDDLTNLLSSVQMPIVMLGPDLRIRRFTPAAEKLLNLIPADIGRPMADIKLALSVTDLEEVVLDVIDTVRVRELEVQDRHGRWHSLRVHPYRTAENKIDGAVMLMIDVDRIKGAERNVRESEARFELLANSAPVLIWMNDTHGSRFVNRAYEDFVGALEPEIRSSAPDRFVHPEDRPAFNAAYAQALRDKQPFQARFRFRRGDGEYRWVKTVGTPRFLSDGSLVGFVGGTFDITDMKEAEAALIDLDRGKNEFLAMLAHELRNPLSSMRNASRLLADGRDASIVDQARGIIERQTANMVRMVDDLLDLSRITHGKIQLRVEPTDVAVVVRRTLESTEGERTASNQTTTVVMPETPLWVRGDPMRLDQAFTNLLTNASKFSRPGGRIWVTVERESNRAHGPDESWVAIRIRDNGIGIDATLLPRVFELFVQADRYTDRARTGIGLGLTIAKRLVDLHGGTIEAHSAGNALGSEFVVRLPLLPEKDFPRDTPAPRPGRKAKVTPRRILVVDDNADSADSLRLILANAGHEVRTSGDGAAAAAALKEFEPEVVLLDIALPDMDGYTLARKLRTLPAGRKALLVAVTGFGREDDVRKSREAGIDEHLTKPLDPDALARLLEAPRKR